jgi:hypothetical protein
LIILDFSLQALNRWGYYPLILIGSWAFGTINRIHDFFEPNQKIFWLSLLDVGMAALMVFTSNHTVFSFIFLATIFCQFH